MNLLYRKTVGVITAAYCGVPFCMQIALKHQLGHVAYLSNVAVIEVRAIPAKMTNMTGVESCGLPARCQAWSTGCWGPSVLQSPPRTR